MPDRPSIQKRISWIDTARGAGIILVVIGHVCVSAGGGDVSWFLFLFHMPFFFIIAGILSRGEKLPRLIRKRTRSLLVPYAAFLVLGGGLLIGKDGMSGLAAGNDLLNLIYGGDRLTGYLGVFWFVTCLFAAQIIFNVVLAAAPSAFGAASLLAAVCWAAAVLLAGHPGPLAIGVAPFAVAMLWVGYAYGSLVVRTWPVALAAAAAAAMLIACRPATLHLDMKHADFGPPVTGAVLAVALSLVALELCKGADRLAMVGPFLRWAVRGSLLIMFLHQPVHFATGKLHVPEPVVALASLLVPLLAFELVRRSSLLSTLFLGVSGRHERPLPPLATTPRLHAT